MTLEIAEILKVFFLGIVEGITEWLPISSTGHMFIVDEFLQLNASDSFKEMSCNYSAGSYFSCTYSFGKRCFLSNLKINPNI